jgi:hypothetical protein
LPDMTVLHRPARQRTDHWGQMRPIAKFSQTNSQIIPSI